MSMLRRVLLLLSVAVLLREGSANSPLDFLRDLKNRIFASSNSTESTEEPSVQCSGLDQDGVCTLRNTAVNGSLEESVPDTFENPDLNNGSLSSDSDILATTQLEGNGTVEETYNSNNTQYYDEQEWNTTATNNTDNYRNDFEYSENVQNETDVYSEAPPANEEINNQTKNMRSKRQINKVEINITLKTPGATSKPLILSTTVLTGKSENFTNSDKISYNATGGKEAISNASIYNTSNALNESSITTDAVKSINETNNIVMTESAGNETEEYIFSDDHKTNYSTNATSDSAKDVETLRSNEMISDFSKSQNTTEGTDNNESTFINCTDCDAEEESTNLQNISLSLDKGFNETESVDFEKGEINDNSTEGNNSYITDQTNITMLKDILENSTRIIEKIVQNVIPAISEVSNETNTNGKKDTNLENTGVQNPKSTEEHINSSGTIKYNKTELESGDKIYVDQLNSTSNMTNNSERMLNTITKTSSGTFDETNSEPHLPVNDSVALDNNVTNIVGVRRDKRSINFTILAEGDDGSDFSVSSFPDTTESPVTELPSITITNSTESRSWNGTQEIEVVGPVCVKQYEQCTNSTDCCDNYECIGVGENNTTSYCDLRTMNLTLSTSIPITEEKTE